VVQFGSSTSAGAHRSWRRSRRKKKEIVKRWWGSWQRGLRTEETDVCIWLVTLWAQMGLESLRCGCRQWNEIGGTEVSEFMCGSRQKRKKYIGAWGQEWCEIFFSL